MHAHNKYQINECFIIVCKSFPIMTFQMLGGCVLIHWTILEYILCQEGDDETKMLFTMY